MRLMSLHGMSRDAWQRYTAAGSWYYEVVAPGFKYNLTDIASALGLSQLARAEQLWKARRTIAAQYREVLAGIPGLELPSEDSDRQHSWHLFSIRIDTAVWRQGRDTLIAQLKEHGIGTSVHWQPLHMQPYYRERYGLAPEAFPVAQAAWPRLISLPIYPGLTDDEVGYIAQTFEKLRA
jgi:perosamine synthetase